MGKYVMKEIPKNDVVVLDVPVGYLRVGGQIRSDGEEGMMVFSIAENPALPGDRIDPAHDQKVPAVKIAVHGPGSAAAIAKAFAEMAHEMIDIACDLGDDEDDEESEDDDDDWDDDNKGYVPPCDGFCAFCEGCGSDED